MVSRSRSKRRTQHGKRTQIGIMERVSHNAHRRWRLRPESDKAFLDAVAQRLADAARLPLRLAQARVQQLAVSAGAPRDPGSDARWWKAPRSRERL
jgi:hypothetical protein